MDAMEKHMFPLSISGRESKENFPQSIGDGKMSINLCNGDSQIIKCEEDNSLFNFDSLNLSQPESDTSKDVDLSRSFDFFLEGERLVSSLCGPKIEDKKTISDRSAGKLQENTNSEISGRTDEHYESYDKFVNSLIPISPRNSECLFKKIVLPTEKDSQLKTFSKNTKEDSSIARNNIFVDNSEFQINIPAFSSEYPSSSIKDEFKAKPHFRNWGLLRRSPISDLRRVDDGNHPSRKYEKSSPFKVSDLEVKLPFQYEPLGSKIKNDFPTPSADGNDELHCTEAETKILTRSREYAFCFADTAKTIDKKSSEMVNCEQTETCDYEISFRKSAIEGCLVFEQIIRDFQLKSHECDLESYCRNVKRCASIANNSLESEEVVGIMTQLILCSLKLADSWSTLNSYFGANGNNKYKPKSDDDNRLFKIFKQWQVGSKSILDCLIAVIQSLKSITPKMEKSTNNSLEHSTSTPASEVNPFFNIKNLQFNSDKSIFQFEQTDKEEESNCSKQQQQGNRIENSRMSNFFNCISSKQNNLSRENNDPSNLLFEIQQKAQSLVSKKSTEEKRTKKKWPLTSLDNNRSNPLTNRIPGRSISLRVQNQNEQPIPPFSSGLSTLSTPQMNKSIFENVSIPAMNFMANPFGTTIQNTNGVNTNSNTIPQMNFMYPQTGITFNSKLAVQNKDTNNVFKNEELSGQSTITNQTSGYNKTNMYNQQQMNFMSFHPNFNYQPFNFPNDQKNELIYRTNFCFPDGKMMPLQSGAHQQPSSAPFFYPPFCSNAMHQMDIFNNKYTQDKRQKSLADNPEGDENSETYYEIKSYMKPGSYRVPSKSTFNTVTPNDNLNYIFEDIVVTGIAVPLTKTESFSPSKKSNSKTNVAAKKSPPSSCKPKDSAWRAAVASAEAIGKLVENLKQQTNRESSSQESSGQSEESSKASATESVICLSSETDSKESDSPNKSE